MQRRNTNQITVKVSPTAFQCLLPLWSRGIIVNCQLSQIVWVDYFLHWILQLEVILFPLCVFPQKSKIPAFTHTIYLCQKQSTRDNIFCWSITHAGQTGKQVGFNQHKYYKYILEISIGSTINLRVPQEKYLIFNRKILLFQKNKCNCWLSLLHEM